MKFVDGHISAHECRVYICRLYASIHLIWAQHADFAHVNMYIVSMIIARSFCFTLYLFCWLDKTDKYKALSHKLLSEPLWNSPRVHKITHCNQQQYLINPYSVVLYNELDTCVMNSQVWPQILLKHSRIIGQISLLRYFSTLLINGLLIKSENFQYGYPWLVWLTYMHIMRRSP